MKKLCTLFSLLLLSAALHAQTTVASATITDSTGQVWFGGTYIITFTPSPGFQGPYYYQGQVFSPQKYTGVFDGSGHFSVTLPDNNYISPGGTQWLFVLCAQTIAKCSQLTRTVTGASESFTTDFSANVTPPIFPTGLLSYGYSTAEVDPIPLPGGFFFNVTTGCQNVWNGAGWYANCGGSSGFVSFAAANLDPLFQSIVSEPDGPNVALSFDLDNAAANTIFGNWTGTLGAPAYNSVLAGGSCGDSSHAVGWTAGTGLTCQSISVGTGTVTSVTGVPPVHSTGGTTPAISLQNSAGVNVTAAYGTDTAYPTCSGGAFTLNDFIVGDGNGGCKDSGVSSVVSTRECEIVWGGSGTAFALTSGDDAIANQSCLNDLGSTETITSVKCRSDAGSNTTTIAPTFGSAGTGTSICSGALTCGSSGAYSSSCTVSNASLTAGSNINPVMGGTLTGTSIHVVIKYTAQVL